MTQKNRMYLLKRYSKVILPLLGLWLCLAVILFLWCSESLPLSSGKAISARWQSRTALYDLNGDGCMEKFVLEQRRMTVFKEDKEIWASDSQWEVEDFLLGDLGKDSAEELLLFVWKRGSYGSVRPFWVDADETSYSQHIFLYRLESGQIDPLWMSSRLVPEVQEWELLSDGRLRLLTQSGEDTLWGWRTWGLERLDREKKPL